MKINDKGVSVKSFTIALFACIGLSGCYQQTSNFDIHRAVAFCGTIENIAYINIHSTGGGTVTCMDQTSAFFHAIKVNGK